MYKIGDTVKIIDNNNGSVNKIGDIGKISSKPNNNGSYRVTVVGRDKSSNWTQPSDMVLVNSEPNYEIY